MTRRYGSATLIQIAAVPVAFAAPRVAVAIALLCVTSTLDFARVTVSKSKNTNLSI